METQSVTNRLPWDDEKRIFRRCRDHANELRTILSSLRSRAESGTRYEAVIGDCDKVSELLPAFLGLFGFLTQRYPQDDGLGIEASLRSSLNAEWRSIRDLWRRRETEAMDMPDLGPVERKLSSLTVRIESIGLRANLGEQILNRVPTIDDQQPENAGTWFDQLGGRYELWLSWEDMLPVKQVLGWRLRAISPGVKKSVALRFSDNQWDSHKWAPPNGKPFNTLETARTFVAAFKQALFYGRLQDEVRPWDGAANFLGLRKSNQFGKGGSAIEFDEDPTYEQDKADAIQLAILEALSAKFRNSMDWSQLLEAVRISSPLVWTELNALRKEQCLDWASLDETLAPKGISITSSGEARLRELRSARIPQEAQLEPESEMIGSSVERISIKGFRRLLDCELELRPLTVLIGANGSGKTTLLDALDLLAASAQKEEGKLSSRITDLGGLTDMLTYGRAQQLTLGLSMKVPDKSEFKYEVTIRPRNGVHAIEAEALDQLPEGQTSAIRLIEARDGSIRYYDTEANRLVSPNWANRVDTLLAQVPPTLPAAVGFRKRLASCTHYHVLDVGPRAPVRLEQLVYPATRPGANGEQLAACLHHLRETAPDRFEAIEDTLRVAFPGFKELAFPTLAAGKLALALRDKNFSELVYAYRMSEGMLRFLWLTTLLQSPTPSAVTLIDEPELSLHPELLSLLVDLMREAAQRTQLIVATHSDRFVSFLEPEELVVLDLTETGETKLVRADTLDIKKWLDEYSLGEVWRMGRIGGRSCESHS